MKLADYILCPVIHDYDKPPRSDAVMVECAKCDRDLWIAPSGAKTGLAPICDECVVPLIVVNPTPVALVYTEDAQELGLIPKEKPRDPFCIGEGPCQNPEHDHTPPKDREGDDE